MSNNPELPLPSAALVQGKFITRLIEALLAMLLVCLPTAHGATDFEAPSLPGIPAGVVVDVKIDFGAKGNGVDDDTLALQTAIDATAARGGGTVYIPEGIYLVNTQSDVEPNPFPKTDTSLHGPIGYTHQLWAKSHIRLLGAGARKSILKMPSGGDDPTDRAQRRNRAIFVMGNPHYSTLSQDLVQTDVEIASLGFDLDNGGGRRALQIRNPIRNVRIHDCEGFQSGVEATGILNNEVWARDNHFLNMASNGVPVDQGLGGPNIDIPENITVDHCVVSGLMQLTSDGGAGSRNLWIHHNTVRNPCEFGIALTYTGTSNVVFEKVVIEDNIIESPVGAGVLVGSNYTQHTEASDLITLHVMRDVTIRRNQIHIRSAPVDGYAWKNWGQNAAGIILGGALQETRGIEISDNVITAENIENYGSSRQALRLEIWDMNWQYRWENSHDGNFAKVSAPDIDASTGSVHMNGHNLCSGDSVQFSSLDVVPLPEGLDAFTSYKVERIDGDNFAVLNPATMTRCMLSVSQKGARYRVNRAPKMKDVSLTGNKVTGAWDWNLFIGGASENLSIENNLLCARTTISGSHDSFSFKNNRCTGTLEISAGSLRNSRLTNNVWAVDENVSGFNWAPGIITIANAQSYWREVDFTFTDNTFDFIPSSNSKGRVLAALWISRDDWRPPSWKAWSGVGNISVSGCKFTTPDSLRWTIAPEFLAAWSNNDGLNTLANQTEP